MTKWDELLGLYDVVAETPAWRHLHRPGINLVPGDGPESAETARVMLVGEAPGAQENGQRRPFVGPSGVMLNRLLGVIGLQRSDVFVTNVLKFRPPGNRTPTGSEIALAIDTLRAEWRVIRPVLVIAVGSPAQDALKQHKEPHGRVLRLTKNGHWITSVYHPAFGLRQKRAQEWIEEEWKRLALEIREQGLELKA